VNEGEKKVVTRMVSIYCRSAHDAKEPPCEECKIVLDYALQRLERCPFGEEKPTCASCPIHCYKHDMRLKIKEVMRTAGPPYVVSASDRHLETFSQRTSKKP